MVVMTKCNVNSRGWRGVRSERKLVLVYLRRSVDTHTHCSSSSGRMVVKATLNSVCVMIYFLYI